MHLVKVDHLPRELVSSTFMKLDVILERSNVRA
jgi:hypothetical protein